MKTKVIRIYELTNHYKNVLGYDWVKHVQVISRIQRGNTIIDELSFEIINMRWKDKHAEYIQTQSVCGFLGIERWF